MREAPAPSGLPILGVIPEVVSSRRRLAAFMRFQAECGDVVRLPYGPKTNFVVYHPDGVKHVLQDAVRNYPKSRDYEKLKPLMGEGLITSGGELWARQRKLVQPAFYPGAVGALAGQMAEATGAMLAEWQQRPAERPFDVLAEMMGLTLRVVARAMLGADVADAVAVVGRAVPVALDQANRRMATMIDLPMWIPTPGNLRYRTAAAAIDEVVGRIIAARQADPTDRGDLLGRLLAARDDETGQGMSARQLRDEVMTIFLAGHETTATALAWTWHLLATHPEVEARLHAEVDAVLGDGPPTLDEVAKLTYTTRVLEEAMRLYPPVWYLEREAVEADEIGGCGIAAGCEVALVPYVTHRHPEFWDDPERFDPDRFLPERAAGRHKYAYFPFGGGPRICVGGHFAMLEAKIVLAMVARAYRLVPVPGRPVVPKPSITLRPRDGLWMTARPRRARPTAASPPGSS